MKKKSMSRTISEALKFLVYIVLVVTLVLAAVQLVILRAPAEKLALQEGATPDILDKLGSQTAVAVVIVMVALVAWVFWLFIQFGRRLSERGYLGPLTSNALARAQIAREEDDLREDLKKGVFVTEINVRSEEFRKRFGIPKDVEPPFLTPGVDIDESGRVLSSDWSTGGGWGTAWGDTYSEWEEGVTRSGRSTYHPENFPEFYKNASADTLAAELKKAETAPNPKRIRAIEHVIAEKFRAGYQEMQLELYYEERREVREKAREHASALLPGIDVSTFGGGWVFVLEFTTIIFIVFAVLALGFVGVLGAEQIGTILAAIAGYVLGKSTTIRGGVGQEIVRGAEEPKALMDAITKQADLRFEHDEEKVRLKRQVEDLQTQLAKTKTAVPNVVGLDKIEAEKQVKDKGLLAASTEVVNEAVPEGQVFQQLPGAGDEVEKGTTVMLLVARKPEGPGDSEELQESEELKEPEETQEPDEPQEPTE